MRTSLFLLAAIGAEACQRERTFKRYAHSHVKRQAANATFPPVLDPNEQILINSFDNTSISTWSYYYTHGDHIAGRNESMAQWTADKWESFGFTSRLDEYCKFSYHISHTVRLSRPELIGVLVLGRTDL
jgi:N-acetylated-alpha-linked acidic dipeptidase